MRSLIKKTVLIFLVIAAKPYIAPAQTDTAFWFAAPEVSVSSNSFDIPIVLRISTLSLASTVTISQPANPGFVPITVNIPANSTSSTDLSAFLNIIENKPPNTTLNYGLHISATQPVTAYYEVVSSYCGCNPEIYALKGRNSLGTYFLIPSQTYYNNSPAYNPVPYSSFNIIATENGTTVTITPSNNIVGHTAGTPFVISLNRGQCYSATATSQLGAQHLQGSVVNSNYPVAITYSDDLLAGPGGCADLAGDQIVPVSIVGQEYIVAKGSLNVERVAVMGTQNGTSIYLDGNAVPVATVNTGQTYEFTLTNPSVYINASAPVYVLHVSGNGCEIGAALLPSIVCTGSQQIGFTRSSTVPFYLNLVAHTSSTGFFVLNGNGTYVTPGMFTVVPGTGGQWSCAHISFNTTQVPVGAASLLRLSNGDVFHMGILNGDATGGCSYGYFSDFNSIYPNASASDASICLGESTTLNASGGMTYNWFPAGGLDSSNVAHPVATPVTTTTYYVTVNNSYGCSATDSLTITVNPNPSSTLVKTDVLCYGMTTGAIDLGVTGGTQPFSYHWSNNATTQDLSGLGAGVYSVTVTDINGCSTTNTASISQPPLLTLNLTAVDESCANGCDGQVVTLVSGGTPNYSYIWSNGQTTPDALSVCAGNYGVTLTDANGCQKVDTATVGAMPPPNISAGNDTIICLGGSAQLQGSGGLTYHWSPATGLSDTAIANPIANPQVTTSYYLSSFATSSSVLVNGDFEQGNAGFSSSYTYSASINNESYYYVINNPNVWHGGLSACPDHTTGTGLMMVINGAPTPNVSIWCETVNVTPNTDYAFTCWLQSVHPTSPAILQFSINGVLIGPPFNASSTVCLWQQFYAIWNSGTNTSAQICIVNQNTAYTGNDFALDDISFSPICEGLDTVTIFVSHPVATDSVTAVSCFNGSDGTATVSIASGATPYTYVWSTVPVQNTQTATGLQDGTYYVTVTDAAGCIAYDTVTISEATELTGNIVNMMDATCYGDTNGAASVTAAGGTPPYTYTWSNGDTGLSAGGLGAGNYSVTVKDSNDCTLVLPFTIDQPNPIQITLNAQNESCAGSCNGSAAAQIFNGVPPLGYTWSTGDSTAQISGLCPGNYSLTVTDSNHCTASSSASIATNTTVDIGCSMSPETGFTPAEISFYCTGSGATLYNWDFGDGGASNLQNPVHTYLLTGNYSITLIVNSGAPDHCADTCLLTIFIDEPTSVFLPNFFSPDNGDEKNDEFYAKTTGRFSEENMVIYNRWGRKVYEWNTVGGRWDGTALSGGQAADGVYFYIFYAKGMDGVIYNLNGIVTLMR